jgi:hypothetical protein
MPTHIPLLFAEMLPAKVCPDCYGSGIAIPVILGSVSRPCSTCGGWEEGNPVILMEPDRRLFGITKAIILSMREKK